MEDYDLCGLKLRSEHPIPWTRGRAPTETPDVELLLEANEWSAVRDRRLLHLRPAYRMWGLPEDRIHLEFVDGLHVLIEGDRKRIGIDPGPQSPEDVSSYLLGPVLGIILRLRGIVCLHAGAFVTPGGAIAVVGSEGSGKSTTAAALAQRGLPVLADDIVALLPSKNGFVVPPGPTSIRLWPRSVEALFGSPDALPPLTPTWEKRGLDLAAPRYAVPSARVPLRAIYFLGEREAGSQAPRVEPMSERDALLSLVVNSYGAEILDRQQRAAEFEVFARLVKMVSLRRLISSTDITRLPAFCDTLLRDTEELAPCSPAPSA